LDKSKDMKTANVIDGPITEFPLFGPTAKQEADIKALYRKAFGKNAPNNAQYASIRHAVEFNKPINS